MSNTLRIRPVLSLACVLMLSALGACSLAPQHTSPSMAVPERFAQSPSIPAPEAAIWQPASSSEHNASTDPTPQASQAWWESFQDKDLNALQARVLTDNHSLQANAAQWRAAQALLDAREANRWPLVSVQNTDTRSRNASLTGPSGIATAKGNILNTYTLSGSVSWDADLWGRLSSEAQAAQAELNASANTLYAARLSLQTTLAQSYFALRTAEAQASLLQRSIQAYEKSLELTQNRYRSGVSNAADVAQARSQLQSARAQWQETQLARTQYQNAIAVLLGQAPAHFHLPVRELTISDETPLTTLTLQGVHLPPVPDLVPSVVLQRRPDIAAAERQVAAANARIGVAKAAFFPSVGLSATAGYRSNHWSQLLNSPSQFWSLGPALALTVFDAGARKAATAQAQAVHDQATANYRQTVLNAFQEVENNLASVHHLTQEIDHQTQALQSARQALAITQNQYRSGTVSYLNVTTAQTTELNATTTLLNTQNRLLQALTVLLKNTAGGWE